MKQFIPKATLNRRIDSPARWFCRLALLVGLVLYMATSAMAAMPPAGSVIGNQATATYTDQSGQTKTATSNLVETTVQQVGSFTLVQDNTKTAAIGNTAYMPHTLTNTGNGSDSFVLTTSDFGAGDTDFATNINIYLDANADGVPDNTTPLATGLGSTFTTSSLPAGGTYSFVVAMTVPATATAGQQDQIFARATASTPALYTTSSISNTDTLIVAAGAAFQVNKSISVSQGPASGTLTYTLTYRNTGAASGNIALQDVIGSGATAGYSYVANSAVWSAGASALSDAAIVSATPDADVGGMKAFYEAITLSPVTTIKATIQNVGPNVTGTISFQVTVLPTATVGIASTTNTAYYSVDLDSDPTNNAPTQPTNPSSYNVLASYSVILNDGTAGPTDGGNTRLLATAAEPNADLSYIASASPGQTISFNNTVWNTGNTSDTFNITTTALTTLATYSNSWPAGTTFQLFKSDGVTPLMDTNGDGIADTGSLAAGASYVVVLKATLPTSACTAGVCPAGPFDVEKKATSVSDPTKSNTTYDRLGSIIAPMVDLANSSGAVDPAVNQDAIGGAPTTTNTVLPGGTTTFNLYIRNESSVADTYSLAYSGTNAFSPATNLPAGWTLKFMDGSTLITSVGPLAAGAEKLITAVVTVPANAVAGTTNVYFQVQSQVTGASDAKWDAVTVSPVNSLTLQPSNSGQVYPGGTVVYPHTLSNTGNTSCGTAYNFTINESLAAQGWTYVLYSDVNNNGVIDAGDTVIDLSQTPDFTTTIAPGGQYKILVKVFAPAGAAAGSTDVVSLSISGTCGVALTPTTTNTATDTTTVVTGQVRLTKTQALDAACNGTAGAFSANPQTAKPGECIMYRVVGVNEGLGNVTALTISDTLPAYTLFQAGPTCSTGAGAYVAPTFSCSGIILAPAASATMDFSVKVQQ